MQTTVLIPGILGSTLSIDGEVPRPVWKLPAVVSPADLRLPDPPGRSIVATGANPCYDPIRTRLKSAFDLRVFAYDWRHSVADIAARFQRFVVEQRLGRFHIVAHSMGGLIARTWIGAHPASFHGRLVMLGTPNHGSWLAPALLGLNAHPFSLAAPLALLTTLLATFRVPLAEMLPVARTWPGAWDLLPHEHTGHAARELHTQIPAEVRARHDAIDHQPFDPVRMHYIGGALPTSDLDAHPLLGALSPLLSMGDSVVPLRIGLVHEHDVAERIIVDHINLTTDPIVINRVVSLLS